MKKRFLLKLLSITLAIVTTAMSLPLHTFAQAAKTGEVLYLKELRLVQAETREEAKISLEDEGFIFLNSNLNEGTDEEGVWLGYTTTTDPTEAIYDMKLMNMNGGFTLTSVEETIKTQKSAFAEMVADLEMLIDEFVEAYNEGLVPAQNAYRSLNFFRLVEGETELVETNGLGYQLVHGGVSTEALTQILMFCDATIVDSIVKILTMGIQLKNQNWLNRLSKLGPYDEELNYENDENGEVRLSDSELSRRAKQLKNVLDFYAKAYDSFEKLGMVSGSLDENFNLKDAEYKSANDLSPEELAVKKAEESRYKFYKIVYDELETYAYGTDGNLKEFFTGTLNEQALYPMVSVLSDGEFAAISYGCFLDIAMGANAKTEDFNCYDEVYADATEEVQSIYLYDGIDESMLSEDSVIGFTEEATRHMAATGELEFFENETFAENALKKGLKAAEILGVAGLAIMGVAKVTAGITSVTSTIISFVTAGATVKSAACAGVIKVCSMIGGPWGLLITVAVVATTVLVTWLISVISEEINGKIDWDENPMPEYLYDVRNVGFTQSSEGGEVSAEYVKRPVFGFYEAVCDENGQVVDLNARSNDATQWIGLYVSYDRLGDDAKPIKADNLLVKTGDGQTPNGYKPLTRFSEIVAYDLNQWDDTDEVNGIYLFYKQDETVVSVDKGTTYYIGEIYLQAGESPAHCIALLEKSGYIPINVNLSPDCIEKSLFGDTATYTYIGYKTTTDPEDAIRDLRVIYGPNQGEIKLGEANYVECGSNGWVTLYMTKFFAAGTPILEGGLLCVSDREDAPSGYEPVNFFGGGPAVSFNYVEKKDFLNYTSKGIAIDTQEYFLYFLPQKTFTHGDYYVGGLSYFFVDTLTWADFLYMRERSNEIPHQKIEEYMRNTSAGLSYTVQMDAFLQDYLLVRSGYEGVFDRSDRLESIAYTTTYNPYRAIYEIKGTNLVDSPEYFTLEGQGYASWNRTHLCSYWDNTGGDYQHYISSNEVCVDNEMELTGKFYVSGNPSADNFYNEDKGAMDIVQPLKFSDIICKTNKNGIVEADIDTTVFKPVTDVFKGENIVEICNTELRSYRYEEENTSFKFYTCLQGNERKYVSKVMVVDELSIYRGSGGADAGIKRDDVTDAMMYRQLTGMGATNFCSYQPIMKQWKQSYGLYYYDEIDKMLFGYTRVEKKKDALTDLFIYVNEFSFDTPPETMYRGNVKYTLLCELPYNLTGYDGAPSPGIWLYGTTSTKAGGKIIGFDVSASPFKNGYETVRTYEGRSPWALLSEKLVESNKNHFLGWAESLYEDLIDFFTVRRNFHSRINMKEHEAYYFHIKREGDDLRTQKPYVEEVYLSSHANYEICALDNLFDLGAEDYVDVDLNKDAGGKFVLLGYKYTEDPDDAINDIAVLHTEYPPMVVMSLDRRRYDLASDLDLNLEAGGDYIYLYTTKHGDEPIIDLNAAFSLRTTGVVTTEKDASGQDIEVYETVVSRLNNGAPSNLNAGAGGEELFLYTKKLKSDADEGTYKEPNYGRNVKSSRSGVAERHLDPDGKYIADLFVMDKETIRKELNYSHCYRVSDQQVFDRLTEMGATEIIKTPISVNSRDFDIWNDNKVYIGYNRTNNKSEAVKDLAIHVELISYEEPKENIDVNRKNFKLVAEAASSVEKLPEAINLLSIGDGNQVAFPKMYLYKSKSGNNPPITDICIDQAPLRRDWNTVRSSNGIDPFVDIQTQAHEHYLLADKDDLDSRDSELVYTDPLFEWMDDVSEIFDPVEENVTIFYIHTKNYEEMNMEAAKPYIQELFLATGDTRHDALTQLVAYAPDGFVDTDLNQDAGGKYVYLGYKRTDKASAAIRDLMICEGEDVKKVHRVYVEDKRIRYDLVQAVDLNAEAGGKYLYLYYTKSSKIGNPVLNVCIVEDTVPSYSVLCGVERNAVLRVEDSHFTDECIDLNKRAGGDYLYMYMQRETTAGHRLIGYNVRTEHKDATCSEDGYDIRTETCFRCKVDIVKKTVISATGKHVDKFGDGDHNCDVCRKKNISTHTAGQPVKENYVDATCKKKGSYQECIYCSDCGELMSKKVVEIDIDPKNHAYGASQSYDHVEGTCTVKGSYRAVIYCSLCAEAVAERIIDRGYDYSRHTPGKPVEENRIEPTETTEGSYQKVIYCSDCGAKLSEETITLPVSEKAEPDENVAPVDTENAETDESPEKQQNTVGSIMGEGSVLLLCSMLAVAVIVAIIIFLQKKKKK